ncbi:hypothetical protein AB0C76_41260 [Kitasatospora sp. NPDC048722]
MLLGREAANAVPLPIVAGVTAFIAGELLRRRAGRTPAPVEPEAARAS